MGHILYGVRRLRMNSIKNYVEEIRKIGWIWGNMR
jgi:hypothetical protein